MVYYYTWLFSDPFNLFNFGPNWTLIVPFWVSLGALSAGTPFEFHKVLRGHFEVPFGTIDYQSDISELFIHRSTSSNSCELLKKILKSKHVKPRRFVPVDVGSSLYAIDVFIWSCIHIYVEVLASFFILLLINDYLILF